MAEDSSPKLNTVYTADSNSEHDVYGGNRKMTNPDFIAITNPIFLLYVCAR